MSERRRKSSQRLEAQMTAQDAAVFDAHVVPRYNALFGRMLLAEIPQGERRQVLDVGCGTGYPALEVLRRLGDGGRVIAIDSHGALVDLARRRALAETGRRIFFKVESPEALTFGDDVFDLVIGNLVLAGHPQPELALSEMLRVLSPGGTLVLTHALEGTFEEINDAFRELALKRDDSALLSRVDRIGARYPSPSTLEAVLRNAGFEDVQVKTEEFQIPFASAAQIFADPAIRFNALPEWRWVAGFEAASEEVLGLVERTLDTYFGGGPLSLRVRGGVAVASA